MPKVRYDPRKDNSPEATFGRVLTEIRKSRRMSQEKLAEVSGYHRTYISQLECGLKSPSLRTLFALAPTLGVKPSQIIKAVERRSNFRLKIATKR
jgi:transcriptional regulator with XRE-family HTH domain